MIYFYSLYGHIIFEEAWCKSLLEIIIIMLILWVWPPPPPKKRNHTHERTWICGWMNRNYEEVDINAWDGSFETSKRRRLHRSLYLWDCICWNLVSNFLVIFLCSQAKLETDILVNLATNIVMIYALLCTRNLSPIFSSGKVGTHIFRLWTFMPVYTDFEHRCWWSLTYSVTHILTFLILQIEEMAFSVFFL